MKRTLATLADAIEPSDWLYFAVAVAVFAAASIVPRYVTRRAGPGAGLAAALLTAVLGMAALLAAGGDSAGPTAPDSWLRVATKHGTVAVQPGVDPARAVRYIESGFTRARTRTRFPADKVDRYGVDGLTVALGTWGHYHGLHLIEIQAGAEFSLDHELQHWLYEKGGGKGPCLQYQDHAEHALGGCNLDSEWAQ